MAQIIKADGTIEEIGDGEITLAVAQEAVDGFIEVVKLGDGEDVLLVNEDGLARNLPLNAVATKLAGQIVVGNVIKANRGQL